MSEPSAAIFISYASDDAEPAARIAEALTAAGLEVWFDKSELRGGEAWDRMISQQIRTCSLFMPIVSARTEARKEGYFRREWRLAVERARDIADDQAFLVPVVLDHTQEKTASVPDRFREVQWTRLPDGQPSPEFTRRLSHLLRKSEVPHAANHSAHEAAGALTHSALPYPARPGPALRQPAPGSRSALRWWLAASAVAVIAVASLAISYFRSWGLQSPPASRQVQGQVQARAQTPTPPAPDTSLVVLPFVDMSQNHDEEYFADGLSEELIDHLSQRGDLRVIARTSSFFYKGKQSTVDEIAHALKVTHLLEGSVRKNGKALRITAQLIRASDGSHLWSRAYDRTLSDLFKVQSDIASEVTNALGSVLTTAVDPARRTTSVEAYNLVLQGWFYFTRNNAHDNERAVDAYRKALKLDPDYAHALVRLAQVYRTQASDGELDRDQGERMAIESVTQALRIDPTLPAAWRVLGGIERGLRWRWDEAESDFRRGLEHINEDPNEAWRIRLDLQYLQALRTGHYGAEYFKLREQDLSSNPLDTGLMTNLAYDYLYDGQFDKAVKLLDRAQYINPASISSGSSLAYALMLMSRPDEALAAARQEADDMDKQQILSMLLWTKGNRAESNRYVETLEANPECARFTLAQIHAWRGEADLAFRSLEQAYQRRETAMAIMRLDPVLKRLQKDARYSELLRKMGLLK